MDAIRKKVMSELFLAPSAVLPIVAGVSAWLVSWGLGGVNFLTIGGLVGVLAGLGWMATRIIFQLDAITERTLRFSQEKSRREEEQRIEALAGQLKQLRDHRALDYLTILRESRREFEQVSGLPNMQGRSLQLVGQVHQLFLAAIEQLELSYKLSELSGRLMSEERQKVSARNEQTLAEIKTTADRLTVAVEQFRRLSLREQNADLGELRDELDESLKVAHRTEERMRELESSMGYDRHLNE
ncbi:MAG: hypothetical protein SGI77_07120 [Pirellulaceae bacterium]|nr:hypothetical protein [Pirellulaceae bacterium]